MWMILVVALMAIVDQLVKYWALNTLQVIGTIPIIQDVFHLTYVENRGMAFSMLQGQRSFFVITTLIILGMIIYALKKNYLQTKIGVWAMLLCAGGAIGNFIDRLFRGFVVDLFDFRFISFPVFNIADILVVCAAFLFFYYVMFQHKEEKKEK